jgi:MerR family transcriptional regulator, light-induced transcriptional regulator
LSQVITVRSRWHERRTGAIRLPPATGERTMSRVTTQARPADGNGRVTPAPPTPTAEDDSGAAGPADAPDPVSTEADEPVLTVAAVARRLGIAPATLRTWDRRYGVGPSDHATGRHRRYAPHDVARLEQMQRALLRGASPAEAARYALSAPARPAFGVPPPAAEPAGRVVAEGEVAPAARSRSGGRMLKLPGASRPAKGLSRAVLAMDSVAAQRLLADAIAERGVPYAWDELVRPVLLALAARWAQTGGYVECEHLLHECVLAAFVRATPLVASPCNPRPVLLACAPGERHSLPLHALEAELATRGVGTRMLGPALPSDALASAVRRIAPAVVVVWAQLARSADPAVVTGLPRARQRSRTFLAGPGWGADVDPAAALPDGVGPAADAVTGVVLGAKVSA